MNYNKARMRSLNTAPVAGVLALMNTFSQTSTEGSKSGVQLTIVNPADLYDPAPNGYSHVVIAGRGTRIAYIAGQGGEAGTGTLPPNFADHVKQAYANLRTTLDAAGAAPSQVAKITTYVVDYDQSMLQVLTRHVKATFGDALPAQTLVPVPRLALDGMLFEVDAVAVLD